YYSIFVTVVVEQSPYWHI
ncbi:unnamed protein product, partial [Rotaria sp. Silwood1]